MLGRKKQDFEDNIYMKIIYYVYCFLMMNIGLIIINLPFFITINFITITTQNCWFLSLTLIPIFPAFASMFEINEQLINQRKIDPFKFFFLKGLKNYGLYGLKYGAVTVVLEILLGINLWFWYATPIAKAIIPFFLILSFLILALSLNMIYFRVRNIEKKEIDILRVAFYYLLRKWYVSFLNFVLLMTIFAIILMKPQFGFLISPSVLVFIIYLNCSKLHPTELKKKGDNYI